ncbi:MAG: tetratricopeptide repeat protein [Nitrospira sp.]|nr:tetratricopeptide repeat protein [Nitrospira sp.]
MVRSTKIAPILFRKVLASLRTVILVLTAGVTVLSAPSFTCAAGCDAVVGKWAWFVGGEVTISSDGTFTQQSGNSGTWTCADASKGAVTLTWAKGGFVNKVRLTEDQQALSSGDPSQPFVSAKRTRAKGPVQTKHEPTPSRTTSSSDFELFTKGRDLAASGKCREAIPYFDQAIAANARYSKAYSDRGRCLASLGERDRGLQALDRAVQLAPNDLSPYFNRAGLRADAGDGDGALADLDRSIQLDPMNPASRRARAGLFEAAGRAREGQLDRDIAYKQIETLKSRKRPVLDHVLKSWRAKSVRLTSVPLQESKDPLQTAFDAAEAGRTRVGLAILDSALSKNPSNDALLAYRARLHLSIGQPSQAVDDLTAVLQRRSSAANLVGRGLAYRQLCRFREEIADYGHALKEDPRYTRAYLERAFTTMNFQKGNDPAPDLTTVIELEPQNWWAYYLRGQEYGYWFKKLPLAIADNQRVIELKPDFAQAYCNIAFALQELGRKNETEKWLQKCFALDPSERVVAK